MKFKQFLSLALALLLVLTLVPMQARATEVASGTCGDNLTWVLDDGGTLTIFGTGSMYDFGFSRDFFTNEIVLNYPWRDYVESIINVVITEGVKNIGEYAFCGCKNLINVTIAEGVTSIGDSAFQSCDKLGSINIPASVTSIGEDAFFWSHILTGVWVASGNQYYSSDRYGVLYDKNKTTLWVAPTSLSGKYTIPITVKAIMDYAFSYCDELTDIVIPNGVEEIGYGAFENCNSLSSVSIPASVTYAEGSFCNCQNLSGIWVNSANQYYSSDSRGVLFSKDKKTLYQAPGGLKGEYVIPGTVTEIDYWAFEGCKKMTNVIIPEGVTELHDTFLDCTGLTEVQIPDSVTYISGAFEGCTSLRKIALGAGLKNLWPGTFEGCTNLKQIIFTGNKGCRPPQMTDDWGDIQTLFQGITATAYYPTRFSYWSADDPRLRDYGGSITWLPSSYDRIFGENRYATSLEVAEAVRMEKVEGGYTSSYNYNLVIANGANFADALSGSYLAAVKDAPLVLSWDESNEKYNYLNDELITYIRRNVHSQNYGGTIYILGGTSAVPASIEEALLSEDYNVVRLAGANRFETNLLILQEAGVHPGDEVLVCTGSSFADSLSASATGKPILMVSNEYGALTESQAEYLSMLDVSYCIVGGENAISADLESIISGYGTTSRLAGINRFETSVMVAERYFENPESVVLAYGWNYPDGLCGGFLAYSNNGPLILSMAKYESYAAAYVQKNGINNGIILGGRGLLSDLSASAIFYGE